MDKDTYAPERRPIASRERAMAKRVASWLVARGASPNAISMAGMCAGVLAGAGLALTTLSGWRIVGFILAAALMQLRLLANMFDGMVAVASGKASPIGELFNEIPDRISDTAILIGAGYAMGGWPALGYLAACAAMFTAYIRAEGSVAGAPQQFCGPMAKQQRMFVLTLACLYAALAPLSWQPSLPQFGRCGVIALSLAIIIVGTLLTAMRRLGRIAAALRGGEL